MRNSLKTFVSFPWLLVPRTLLHAKGCCLSLKDLRDPRGEFPSLQRILFPVYISITTPLGLAQELWEDGWRRGSYPVLWDPGLERKADS